VMSPQPRAVGGAEVEEPLRSTTITEELTEASCGGRRDQLGGGRRDCVTR
jgi:hypothetical protein